MVTVILKTSSYRMAVANESIENQSLIKISGETFDITEAPSADSSYVQEQVVEIASGIVVSKLNDDLRDMGRFTRIALHCAVVRADPKLEGNIQEFGIRLATLCDDSAIAIGRFQRTSTTVIETLQAGYSYLLEGLEDMALDNLEDVQHAAEEMEVISKELHERFEDESKALKSMKDEWGIEVSEEEQEMTKLFLEAKEQAEKAMKKKKSEDENPGMLLDEVREERKEDTEKIEQAIKDAEKSKLSAEEQTRQAQNVLSQQIRDQSLLQLEKNQAMEVQARDLGGSTVSQMQSRVRDLESFLGNGWKCFWSSGSTIRSKRSEKDHLRERLDKVAKHEKVIREKMDQMALKQRSINQQQSEVDRRRSDITKFQSQMEMEQRALESLQKELLLMAEKRKFDLIRTIDEKLQQRDYAGAAMDVIAATKNSLMSIAVTMLQVAGFWNRMAAIAKELQSERVRKRVKKAVECMSPEKRLKVWTSQGFKKDAIANYAKWVSYRVLCNEYMKGITSTRAELYACLKEPILPTEAAEKLKVLLKHQQQQLDQKFVENALTSGE